MKHSTRLSTSDSDKMLSDMAEEGSADFDHDEQYGDQYDDEDENSGDSDGSGDDNYREFPSSDFDISRVIFSCNFFFPRWRYKTDARSRLARRSAAQPTSTKREHQCRKHAANLTRVHNSSFILVTCDFV